MKEVIITYIGMVVFQCAIFGAWYARYAKKV